MKIRRLVLIKRTIAIFNNSFKASIEKEDELIKPHTKNIEIITRYLLNLSISAKFNLFLWSKIACKKNRNKTGINT